MASTQRRISSVVVALSVAAACMSACSTGGSGDAAKAPDALEMSGAEVVQDPDGTGVEVSKRMYPASEAVVVATKERNSQLLGAAIALERGIPLLVRWPGTDETVDAEIDRLGATEVITPTPEEGVEPLQSERPEGDIAAVAAAQPQKPGAIAFPPILVTEETSLGAAVSARAAGAELEVLQFPDPRVTSASMRTVLEQDTLALGMQWGDTEAYRDKITLATHGELPGGGGLVFPGRRMVALYGHPSGPALGVMGEQPPVEAAQLAKEYVQKYQPLDGQSVIPAFEIIVTVASQSPGADGDYSNETAIEDIVPYIDAITEAGGYAVLDLQPGQGDFLHQARLYEELLLRPNVGLALDAEWKLNPGEQPLSRIGSATSEEINAVADWLANLVREHKLPQKALILHQFRLDMYPDRENIRTDQPELAWVLHADGHGAPEQKFDTWNVLRQGLSPDFFMAWKNFIDEDTPTFSPEQTYNDVQPRPWFVSYQ
ncbi:cell wall-binding repeat 2 family protein [Corynebacterium sp. NML130628]|uniref:cell wall-binding repeat 2 family protein n=1 Tax=Corynebacterium sp. NML130628 TaxID=1906333 RepID=UPI0009F98F8A|nr:cell wall-binding repeat 2 family protein [Corynebacterium sp. NML130628]